MNTSIVQTSILDSSDTVTLSVDADALEAIHAAMQSGAEMATALMLVTDEPDAR